MVIAQRKQKKTRSFATVLLGVIVILALLMSLLSDGSTTSSSLLQLPSQNIHGNLVDLVQEKSVEISQTKKIPGDYPSLSSLVEVVPDSEQPSKTSLKIVSDVQFLLDYAIIGFSKCGTTTLLKWIRRDPEVVTFKREIHEILDGTAGPGSLVERLYQNLLEENPFNKNTTTNANNKGFLQGFKNPEILQVPTALRHINNYWPETKLIVSVRNPLKWFRSFYNFRLTIGHLQQVGKDPNALIGHCDQGGKILCSNMGAFHVKLFRLGKTAMSSQEEFDLVKPFLVPSEQEEDRDIWNHINGGVPTGSIPRMKNRVFFLDLRQMSDSNRTRAKIFRRDLQTFLGLQNELSPVFRARPFKQLELAMDDETKRHKMDTICNPKYQPLQEELFAMAQKASLWIRHYFLKSEDVVVSSPDYLEELLKTWMQNPCDEANPAQG